MIKRIANALDLEYKLEKKRECEELHNAIAQVISDHKATAQNILYVLEFIKWQVLNEEFAKNILRIEMTPEKKS